MAMRNSTQGTQRILDALKDEQSTPREIEIMLEELVAVSAEEGAADADDRYDEGYEDGQNTGYDEGYEAARAEMLEEAERPTEDE